MQFAALIQRRLQIGIISSTIKSKGVAFVLSRAFSPSWTTIGSCPASVSADAICRANSTSSSDLNNIQHNQIERRCLCFIQSFFAVVDDDWIVPGLGERRCNLPR